MAHEIEVVDGIARMFYVGDAPWHGLGIPLNEPPTIDEAIRLAGLNWTVSVKPLVIGESGIAVPANAVVRDDGSVIGVVGGNFTPLQNLDAFRWFQPFIDSKQATLETAGSLKGGRKVWVLARLAGDPIEVAKNDMILRYLLLSNGHDGTISARAGFTATRVVCANTLHVAHTSETSKLIRVLHTPGIHDALDRVREIMSLADQQFKATAEQMKRLTEVGVVEEDLKKYVRKVFQNPVETKQGIEAPEDANENLLAKIVPLFEEGPGAKLPGVAGTLWGAYNAVTAFTSHARGRSQDSRLDSLWFGDSARINKRALEVALRMAA